MLTVEYFRTYDHDKWRTLVASMNGGPFHLPEILLPGNKPENLVYLVMKDGQEVVGACVGLSLARTTLRILKTSKDLYLPTIPAVRDGTSESVHAVCEAARRFAAEAGYRHLLVDPRWGADFSQFSQWQGFVTDTLCEFTLDLSCDLEVIFRAMHKKHRKNIRSAEEHGLQLVEDSSLEGFLALRGMQLSSAERSSTKGNSYGVQNEKYYEESYRQVYQTGLGRVMFARKDGSAVAALAYLAFGKKAVTVRSGSTAEGYETSAMYLLQYELIRKLQEQGVSELNIGGVPSGAAESNHPQHGLYDYKRYYGGKPHIRTGLKIRL